MVRDYLYSLCGGALMIAASTDFGAYIAPEPAEMKLGWPWAGTPQTIPVRTLPPEVRRSGAWMVWIGTAGPEIWCPAAPLARGTSAACGPDLIAAELRIPTLHDV
jgi:hypothetical protein